MDLVPKWLRDWMTRLMPQQQSSGSGAMHMGHVGGSVHNVTQMQRDGVIQVGKVGGDMHVVHETHHHYGGRQRGAVALGTTPEQRAVLALMRTLPERPLVLEFMRREFRTAMVNELAPDQLYRVRRYVERINASRGVER